MSDNTQNDAPTNAQPSAHKSALDAALAVAQQSTNAKPMHLQKKPYMIEDFLDEIEHDYRAENKRYLENHLRQSDADFPNYAFYSSPVRDHRNASLIMWSVIGKYIHKNAVSDNKTSEKLFAGARKCGIIALENKFTTIIS